MLADGRRAVVTGEAGADDVGVIDPCHRQPAAGAMAVLADRVGLDVVGVLAGGFGAVVTAGTIAGDVAVVEHCAAPAVGGMAVITAVGAGDVRWMLADGGGAVVTGEAGTDDIRMIDTHNRDPAGVAVTVFADAVGLDMGGVLAGSVRAVVAAGAIAGDVAVVEDRAAPAAGVMAVVAAVVTGDMVG